MKINEVTRKDPQDRDVEVPGVGVYNVRTLQTNIARKLEDLAQKAKAGDPHSFRQIKKLIDQGILQLFLDTLVGSYDDIARQTIHRRQYGEAEEQSQEQEPLPIDFEGMTKRIQQLESAQYITPEEADQMRRAIQAIAGGRTSVYPDAILQFITVLLK